MKFIDIKSVFSIFLLLACAGNIAAQSPSKRQFIEAAESEFADKNYYGALIYYNEALEYDNTDKDITFKAGEAARLFNAYSKAAEKYHILIDTLNDESHPIAIFWLGNMKQRMGKYDEAQKYYEMYLSEFSGIDTFYTAKAKKELASIEYANSLSKNYKRNKI